MTTTIDTEALAAELRAQVRGEVRFDEGSRALYATDYSNYRQVPIGVVIPKDVDDVIKTVEACPRYGAPLLARGAGTSLAGQCCNVAVVIDMSKYMNRVDNIEELEILTYDGLRMRVGKTSDEELEHIIKEGGRRGEIYAGLKALRDNYADLIRERFPKIPRLVSGYNLDQLLPENGLYGARALVGTENTCIAVLEATVRLVASPPARALLVLGYPDIYSASDDIMEILSHQPIALEGMDDLLIENAKRKKLLSSDIALLPAGGGWFLVEFGSDTTQESLDRARGLMEELKKQQIPPDMKLFDNPREVKKIWSIRQAGVGATGSVPGEKAVWPGWEDSAVPPEQVGDYLRDLRHLLAQYDYRWAFYGHFGQGCIHTRIRFDLETRAGIQKFRSFMNEAADLVINYNGSLSGEHGDGQARAELLPKMFGIELVNAFREFKVIWDPDWKMNPGRAVDAYRMDENLRLGTSYHPPRPETHFSFVEDEGSLAKATLRCNGVGKCRKLEGGTMCPSFMVTREEQHSTRGRARLLFEMLQENPLSGSLHSVAVKDALDLCLACKGCKSECPVNVDMATYKAEFLSHYYKGRLRPITSYSMGLIHRWVRVAALMPGVANFFTQTPLLRDIAKRLAGIAPERQIPALASQAFKKWFRKRDRQNKGQPKVILWPDTFNNHFHPQTAIAAVEVLEAAGYQVVVPEQALCCGRPLYDHGMFVTAQRLLRNMLDTLRPQITEGVPLVGLEPSCIAVFRDELINLFPNDEDAKRLSRQTFLLSEFLARLR